MPEQNEDSTDRYIEAAVIVVWEESDEFIGTVSWPLGTVPPEIHVKGMGKTWRFKLDEVTI